MSVVIFAVGMLILSTTVYGTVIVGGLFLTGRQLDQQPSSYPTRLAHRTPMPASTVLGRWSGRSTDQDESS